MKPFERVAMMGIGLINGSLALSLKKEGLAGEIVACARSEGTRARALELGLCDRAVEHPAEAVEGADLVVLGTPPAVMGEIAAAMRPGLSGEAIVTDVASIKGRIVNDVIPHLPEPRMFVPGHPVAGTEHSGPDAAFEGLFRRRRCILTPIEDTDPAAVQRVRAMWEKAESSVDVMTPEHHDRVLAITSHLPHLIAYTIVGTVADLEEEAKTEVFKYAAGGFTDFTRIAASDPTMWRDVFLSNREAVLEMLGRFMEDLIGMQRAIRWSQGDPLFELFTRTRAIRRGVIEAGQAYVRKPADGENGGNAD
ncbi:prephenate/arogenate dehydrogenase family protein (plasmid) [Geminicoccaceae bacterium 1502E]|nr:prephenate/arogenate dehydrogenase family protein [Geminicoccaceae bacterium 1502E]